MVRSNSQTDVFLLLIVQSATSLAAVVGELILGGVAVPTLTLSQALQRTMPESSFISASILTQRRRSFSLCDVLVKLWMIRNQLGRRNLLPACRVKLALMLKPVLKEMAKANQKSHGDTAPGKKSLLTQPSKVIEVRKEIAKAAGVSEDTVRKVETVLKHGDEETKAEMLSGKKKINRAFNETQSKCSEPAGQRSGEQRHDHAEQCRRADQRRR